MGSYGCVANFPVLGCPRYTNRHMDFLDPKKERLNRIVLYVSYALVALAIATASVVLLSVTDGYCVDDTGEVDKCGFVFVSTQPSGATITVDGKARKQQTNTKLNFRSGTYTIRLGREGYRDWERQVTVLGGDVQRFDYPFLFPKTLTQSSLATFNSATTLGYVTQSPDRRWVLVSEGALPEKVHVYDLGNALKPVATNITIPSGIVSASEAAHTWSVLEWADDNHSVLLQHGFTTSGAVSQEYILLNRQTVASSRNLTRDLSLTPTDRLSLFDKKFNQYYAYNTDTKVLRTQSLGGDPPLVLQLEQVLAYKTYADDTILYATTTPPSGKIVAGQVSIVLQQGNQTRVIRQFAAPAQTYVLDVARYARDWYVVVGADTQKGVYVYKNPLQQPLATATALPVPTRFLKLSQPNYAAFSATSQYIAVENGQNFAVYDVERNQGYSFVAPEPLDQPQVHARWMDGDRLLYMSGGKLVVFDYDNLNRQVLQPALPAWPVAFSPDFRSMLTLQPTSSGMSIANVSLRAQ